MWCALAGDGESAKTRGVHALGAVFLGAAQDAEHRAIAHLGSRVAVERAAHDFEHVRPELLGPREQALGGPIAVVLVRLGSVLGKSDGGALARVAAPVGRDADVVVKALDDGGRRAHFDGLVPQREGYAVKSVVELDMVIDVGAGAFALAELEA